MRDFYTKILRSTCLIDRCFCFYLSNCRNGTFPNVSHAPSFPYKMRAQTTYKGLDSTIKMRHINGFQTYSKRSHSGLLHLLDVYTIYIICLNLNGIRLVTHITLIGKPRYYDSIAPTTVQSMSAYMVGMLLIIFYTV